MPGHIGNRHIFTIKRAESLMDDGVWFDEMRHLWEAQGSTQQSGKFEILIFHPKRRFPYHDITSQVIGQLARFYNPTRYRETYQTYEYHL